MHHIGVCARYMLMCWLIFIIKFNHHLSFLLSFFKCFCLYSILKKTDKCHKNCAKCDNIELLFAFSIVALNLQKKFYFESDFPSEFVKRRNTFQESIICYILFAESQWRKDGNGTREPGTINGIHKYTHSVSKYITQLIE